MVVSSGGWTRNKRVQHDRVEKCSWSSWKAERVRCIEYRIPFVDRFTRSGILRLRGAKKKKEKKERKRIILIDICIITNWRELTIPFHWNLETKISWLIELIWSKVKLSIISFFFIFFFLCSKQIVEIFRVSWYSFQAQAKRIMNQLVMMRWRNILHNEEEKKGFG